MVPLIVDLTLTLRAVKTRPTIHPSFLEILLDHWPFFLSLSQSWKIKEITHFNSYTFVTQIFSFMNSNLEPKTFMWKHHSIILSRTPRTSEPWGTSICSLCVKLLWMITSHGQNLMVYSVKKKFIRRESAKIM